MYNVRKINDDIYYLGANDRRIALFENVYLFLMECHITTI